MDRAAITIFARSFFLDHDDHGKEALPLVLEG